MQHEAMGHDYQVSAIQNSTYAQQVRRKPQSGLYSFSFTRIQPTFGTFRPTVRPPLTISFIHIKPECVHHIILTYTQFFQRTMLSNSFIANASSRGTLLDQLHHRWSHRYRQNTGFNVPCRSTSLFYLSI